MAFSTLYTFAANKEAFVESSLLFQRAENRSTWDVRFIWGPYDWEANMVDDFFRFLASCLPLVTEGDRMRWKLTKKRDFTIRSFYHKLHDSSSIVFPWKGIWKVKAPRRASFFVWTATWDRILIRDNLRSKGDDFVDWCIMCWCCGEIVDHLLLHCGKAYRLWCFVYKIFGISWVPFGTEFDILFNW